MPPCRKVILENHLYKASQFKISVSYFKKPIVEPTCDTLFKLKSEGKAINYSRFKEGGEKLGLEN
jgi:hypothetical protein